jgi:hypothetical protein
MARFLTIGYGDEAGYRATGEAVRAAAHDHDAYLTERGAIGGIAGVPVQVRNPDADGVRVQSGAYLRSELPIAGFALLEADDLQHAIELVAGTPCAVAHGVVEVWPLESVPTPAVEPLS